MNDAAVYAAGVDVGGTKIVALRVGADGTELARAVRPTPADDMTATLDGLVAALGEVVSPEVVAVGVGAAGLVEEGAGILRFAPNLAWRDAPIGEVVARATGLPVVVDNDCTAAAYGEFRIGAARGATDVLYLGVGTGIGGGLILHGEVYRGAHGFAAEIGHIVVEPDGPMCGCGNLGCWETVASGTAITREGRAAAREHAPLAARAGGDPDAVTGPIVVEAGRGGGAGARGLVRGAGGRARRRRRRARHRPGGGSPARHRDRRARERARSRARGRGRRCRRRWRSAARSRASSLRRDRGRRGAPARGPDRRGRARDRQRGDRCGPARPGRDVRIGP
jgi:glucokinase